MLLQLKRLSEHSATRFAAVGLANSVFGLSIIYLCIWFLGLSDIPANAIGYTCGTILSFSLNSRWSFRFVGNWVPAFAKFLIVILAAYFANLMVVIGAIEMLAINNYLAHALGMVPYALVGYLGSRYIAFANSNEPCRHTGADELGQTSEILND